MCLETETISKVSYTLHPSPLYPKTGRLTWGVAGPLNGVPLQDLKQRFVAVVKKVQPTLATAHAKLFTHVLGLLNHALGEHRQNRESETPNSLLGGIVVMVCIPPALLHSQDERVKRRQRFASVKREDVTIFSPVADGIHPSGIGQA